MKTITTILLGVCVAFSANSQKLKTGPSKMVSSSKWETMLDKNLTKWEVWTGVPDKSLKNIPDTYVVPADGKPVEAIGLGDPLGIFKVSEEANDALVMKISGEAYAGLTSKKSYSNYHLTMLFKWGEKKWAPRLNAKRDNGLLYHCHGEHGAFWNVWKSCLELQIQEEDFGDLYILAGTEAKVPQTNNRWDPKSKTISKRAKRSIDTESPHGEWTRIDLYVLDDTAIHVVNGEVVLALTDAKDKNGNKLTSGQIQIQSEGAEAYVKEVFIRPIKKFPKKIRKAAGF
ncbi:DUF1080 domain-containing protein [Polaribacter sp. Q13]|uniref:3-keto-disaccharide hydrolase n=1 Tax=Polaribacter sp. Q13 TaxID=2806551 RepID=UPI00193C0FB5|nr:DUF1080 domain-containing protein [Polaribacter sp. Q13]QVY66928.1 DUF1080 domain-containing protein [Polaribacter sp. Q13]